MPHFQILLSFTQHVFCHSCGTNVRLERERQQNTVKSIKEPSTHERNYKLHTQNRELIGRAQAQATANYLQHLSQYCLLPAAN